MKELILAKIASLENEAVEYEEMYGENWEDFNACDASGGNFDDAYELGMEHGETYGKLSLLRELLEILED